MNKKASVPSLTIAFSCMTHTAERVLTSIDVLASWSVIVIIQPHPSRPMNELTSLIKTAPHHVRCICLNSVGISRSRNAALDACQTELLLIADDDQVCLVEGIQAMADYMATHPDVAIATGRLLTPEGQCRRPYGKGVMTHNLISALGINSIEMMIRVTSPFIHSCRFDHRFGLGATYPLGEEGIFITDAIKKGALVVGVPIAIAVHSKESSGERITDAALHARGASFRRQFAWLGFMLLPLYAFRQRRNYKGERSVVSVLRQIMYGFLRYSR